MNDSPPRSRSIRQQGSSRKGAARRRRPHYPFSCKKEIELIASYLDASLDRELSYAFEAHLQACPDCAVFVRTYRKTIEVTAAFLQLQPLNQRRSRLTFGQFPKSADCN